MGNKQSILCCSPSCCSTRRNAVRPVLGDVHRRLKTPSEHSKTSDTPKRASGTSAGNGGSPTNISDPKTQLNINQEKEKIQHKISKELKIKDGAERIRKIIKNEKHLREVEDLLYESTLKLDVLYRRLQHLNACIPERDALHLPGMCEDWNEENAVLTAHKAMNEPQVSNVDNVIPAEDIINEPEKNKDNGTLLEKYINELIESIFDKAFPVVNVDKALLPVDEKINDLEESIVEDAFHPGEMIPELEMPNTYHVFQQQPLMSLEDFRCCSVLGRGAFGKVLLAEHRDSKKMVAIKAIKKMEVIKDEMVHCLMYEKRIFQAVSRGHHPFLVNLIASFQNMDYTFFAMEYAAGGDLKIQLEKSSGSFSTSRARFYTACVVLGLEYLHQQKIIHRDLKLENVVLDHKGFAKITDFGLGKEGIGFKDRASSRCGTLNYMAPEILIKPSYTRAVDWWSLGVLLYVMLLGQFPFSGDDEVEVEENITSSKIRYPFYMDRRSRRILRRLLKRNPHHRLGASKDGAEEVKRHLFFREIKWSKLFSRKVKPPFVPTIRGLEDTRNFGTHFTSAAPVLTPQHQSLTEEQQDAFRDIDWIAD